MLGRTNFFNGSRTETEARVRFERPSWLSDKGMYRHTVTLAAAHDRIGCDWMLQA
jgi:hypothetical protein